MDAYVLDWVNLLLRWAHVIVAIAWIGSSFYFVFLDNSLTKPEAPDRKSKGKDVGGQAEDLPDGELWAVHGGGFYHPTKYMVAPKQIPANLHWFYWESYSTWLTGFALFTVLYLYQASTFLIDKSVYAWTPGAAIAAALGFLVVFWIAYDLICRTLGQREGGDRLVGALVAVLVVFASWLACQLFAGRAAFLLVGAMMATAMSANVFFWIIPGQRTVMAQMKAGQPVDPVHGQRAKQRSVHNTYFTLPVLIAMLSNHYGFLYGAPHNWLVLALIMLAGALIRHSFVARHKALVAGKRVPWEHAIVGTIVIVGLAAWLAPAPQPAQARAEPVSFAQVQQVVAERCAMCHNEQVVSKNVQLHTPELIAKNAQSLYQQAVVLKTMPMNNATQITDAERALIGRWFEAGAPTN
ncbi:urate hydroxylase PuuD [Piscinibacter defluvii]|uniref:urate hydroxylase PuuD n=1 Tax=Piscinibacter defluvii TaxID=1796922 RepID=UPI000FDD0D81|nr:urate hydroxylase PuuD [Piscinibacter defluvii]